MPGIPYTSGTQVGGDFCKGEGFLQRAVRSSPLFIFDITAVREMIATGVIEVEEGVERVDHVGALSPKTKEQLSACLGRIASGKCPNY